MYKIICNNGQCADLEYDYLAHAREKAQIHVNETGHTCYICHVRTTWVEDVRPQKGTVVQLHDESRTTLRKEKETKQ